MFHVNMLKFQSSHCLSHREILLQLPTLAIPIKTVPRLHCKRYAWRHDLGTAAGHASASLFLHAHNINLENRRGIPLQYIRKKYSVNKDKKHFFLTYSYEFRNCTLG